MILQITGDEKTGYDLIGELTYQTVPDLFRMSPIKASSSTRLDLGKVGRVDSAGLALLVEWSFMARAGDNELVLVNVPMSLKSLIYVSGLQKILSISDR